MKHYKSEQGFSLLELMIVVAVIGIISSIAFPAYQDYVARSKIAEATSGLANLRIMLEQHFQDNRTYEGYVDVSCEVDGSPVVDSKNFSFTCDVDATTYEITATGEAAQNMSGYRYTINHANEKKSEVGDSGEVECWLTKKGGSC